MDTIAKKIRRAKTDSKPVPDGSQSLGTVETRPEAFNLIDIFCALTGSSRNEIMGEFGGKPFSEFKPALAEAAVTSLGPMGVEMRRLLNDPVEIDRVLSDGANRALSISEPIIRKVHDIMGFLKP